jgi:methanogenic corrinoid protein MtbC1
MGIMDTSAEQQHSKRHPIQVAARRSGLSLDLLRAWEKRHGVVEPARSAGGQRLYSDVDIERLRLLRLVVDEGRRISDASRLNSEELTALVLEDQVETSVATHPAVAETAVMLDCMDAIMKLDSVRLDNLVRRQLLTLGSLGLIESLIAPLMVEVGRLWHEGRLGSSHEHLATQVLRGIVSRILADSQPTVALGTLVVATTAGQRHEIGGLMAAATAAHSGWRVVYLGADLPAQEIVSACENVKADALGLSFSFRNEDVDDLKEIRAIVSELPARTTMVIGGSVAEKDPEPLAALGARVVGDMGGLRAQLERIAGAL